MKKIIIRILLIIVFIVLLIGGFFIFQGHNVYKKALDEISLNDKIAQIKADKNFVELNSLPVEYKNAVISVEDHRFYDHGAVDFIAITRAITKNITSGKLLEGGSTITQQVAKNLYFISNDSNSAYRKIAEIFMAIDLEKNLKKDDILELYINTIYFGDGYYGIKEACKGYFDKSPSDMTLYEATMLAGIPNAPSIYAPTANFDLTLSRQKKVVSTMVENGYLTEEQGNKVLNEKPKEINKFINKQ